MYGCFVTEPTDGGADLGVVFFHNAGYSTACGHGTIALVTWALENGVLPVREPETRVVVDVPSGRLETWARVEAGRVRSVRFRNVPAYVWGRELPVSTRRGSVVVAVAFGGAFYASVPVGALGLAVEPAALPSLVALGREIKRELEEAHDIVDRDEPELRDVYGVVFWENVGEQTGGDASPAGAAGSSTAEVADGALGPESAIALVQRNVTVFADGEVDRSPCGSATSARLAILHAEGRLRRGDVLRHLSVVGSEFRARVVAETEAAGVPAVVTEVEGSAHLTGRHEFVLDPDDPVGTGFVLR
jgi:proline racemase